MSIVGNKDTFSIEWELIAVTKNNVYGCICFWINNKRLGDFDYECFLNETLGYLHKFLMYKALRCYQKSHLLSMDKLFYDLYDCCFIENELEHFDLSINRTIFWLDDIGDASFRDEIGIILIDEPIVKRQRFIWKELNNKKLTEFTIPYGFFECVTDEFIQQIKAEIEQLSIQQ